MPLVENLVKGSWGINISLTVVLDRRAFGCEATERCRSMGDDVDAAGSSELEIYESLRRAVNAVDC